MNIMSYFLKRPIQAIVLNVMLIVVGVICYYQIPLREYPQVETPKLSIHTHYRNASAELIENSVTAILEDSLAGVEGIEEIHSESKYGSSYILVKFNPKSDLDRAQIKVREALGAARIHLPKEVGEPWVTKGGKGGEEPDIFLALSSNDRNFAELTHYANINLKNPFRSIKGVSDVKVWGQPYTMSVSLDPQKMFHTGVNVQDVIRSLEHASMTLPVGKYQNEVPTTLTVPMTRPSDFENVPIQSQTGETIWLKDIADVSLKSDNKQFRIRINGRSGLIVAIEASSDANPLEVSKQVKEKVADLKKFMPPDVQLDIFGDQADFIRISLHNIKSSLVEAILLVLVIVFIALGTIRATLIPLVTIPISLIGAILFLKLFGYSINTITLLAMILGIGLVVDDAIVVLENISRYVEKGLTPFDAAQKGSKEIGFAILGMTLTLASVYTPIAFIPGVIGQLFIEFAVTLAGAVLISGVVALTLSPLMCTKLLKQAQKQIIPTDKYLGIITQKYREILSTLMHYPKAILAAMFLIVIASTMLYALIPSELAPTEDQGVMNIYVPPLAGKSLDALEARAIEIEQDIKNTPEVNRYITYMGDWGSSTSFYLNDYAERTVSAKALSDTVQQKLFKLPSMNAWAWTRDARLPGIDSESKGALRLAISTLGDYRGLLNQIESLRQALEATGKFSSVYHFLRLDTPGYEIQTDQGALSDLGFSLQDISKTIEIFFSGQQSLHFEKDNMRYAVTLEGKQSPWTLDALYLTDKKGRRLSIGAVADIVPLASPKTLDHYQQMRTAYLHINLPDELKMKAAMDIINPIISDKVDPAFKTEWIGSAKLQAESNKTMIILFGLAILFVYAVLSVLFNHFIDPFIILFTVPLGCFGGLALTWGFNQSMNIYTQIGLVTLVGLITKHGILMVTFANQLLEKGRSVHEAILEASVLRLRPILMTTAAMTIGAMPLMLSTGAGSEARRAIGVVLVGGLLFGTLLTLFILPKMYEIIKNLQRSKGSYQTFEQLALQQSDYRQEPHPSLDNYLQ